MLVAGDSTTMVHGMMAESGTLVMVGGALMVGLAGWCWVAGVMVGACLWVQAAWTPRASCAGCSVGLAPVPRCCRTPTLLPPLSAPRTWWSLASSRWAGAGWGLGCGQGRGCGCSWCGCAGPGG